MRKGMMKGIENMKEMNMWGFWKKKEEGKGERKDKEGKKRKKRRWKRKGRGRERKGKGRGVIFLLCFKNFLFERGGGGRGNEMNVFNLIILFYFFHNYS